MIILKSLSFDFPKRIKKIPCDLFSQNFDELTIVSRKNENHFSNDNTLKNFTFLH